VLAKSKIGVSNVDVDGAVWAIGLMGPGGFAIVACKGGVIRVDGRIKVRVMGRAYEVRFGDSFADSDAAKQYAHGAIEGRRYRVHSSTLKGLVPVRESSRALPGEAA
jgi:hypothetical protein